MRHWRFAQASAAAVAVLVLLMLLPPYWGLPVAALASAGCLWLDTRNAVKLLLYQNWSSPNHGAASAPAHVQGAAAAHVQMPGAAAAEALAPPAAPDQSRAQYRTGDWTWLEQRRFLMPPSLLSLMILAFWTAAVSLSVIAIGVDAPPVLANCWHKYEHVQSEAFWLCNALGANVYAIIGAFVAVLLVMLMVAITPPPAFLRKRKRLDLDMKQHMRTYYIMQVEHTTRGAGDFVVGDHSGVKKGFSRAGARARVGVFVGILFALSLGWMLSWPVYFSRSEAATSPAFWVAAVTSLTAMLSLLKVLFHYVFITLGEAMAIVMYHVTAVNKLLLKDNLFHHFGRDQRVSSATLLCDWWSLREFVVEYDSQPLWRHTAFLFGGVTVVAVLATAAAIVFTFTAPSLRFVLSGPLFFVSLVMGYVVFWFVLTMADIAKQQERSIELLRRLVIENPRFWPSKSNANNTPPVPPAAASAAAPVPASLSVSSDADCMALSTAMCTALAAHDRFPTLFSLPVTTALVGTLTATAVSAVPTAAAAIAAKL